MTEKIEALLDDMVFEVYSLGSWSGFMVSVPIGAFDAAAKGLAQAVAAHEGLTPAETEMLMTGAVKRLKSDHAHKVEIAKDTPPMKRD